MKKILEGSRAIAETIKLCRPAVVSAYPITPQTHIVEDLAKFKADGEADYEYVRAESEFTAASVVLGASATGVRTYTATCSQGLLLMVEVLFNIAGMRLPVVLTCANRAVSSPINIWNDQQDSLTVRDSGWVMLYAETNQEAVDLHIQAYKIAEACALPVMVNLDGFVLTHTYEPVDIPEAAKIKKYLPDYKPQVGQYLDVKNPISLGTLAPPKDYMEIREQLQDDLSASQVRIVKAAQDFEKMFERKQGNGLIEWYGPRDAQTVLVAVGSMVGTVKDVIDESGGSLAVLKLRCFRPFPKEEIIKALSKAKRIVVLEKAISLGHEGIFAGEIKQACQGKILTPIKSCIVGLGGKDVTREMIKRIVKTKNNKTEFVYPI